jgi:23S rRNA (adenine2503-C2)-methyltransferase
MRIVASHGQSDVATVLVGRARGANGPLIEFVDGAADGRPRTEKWIINVSTQFGCPIGCLFCDAGGGFQGNCTADEMLSQVRAVAARHPRLAADCRKLKVHFARMGEPALNDAVLETIARLPTALPAANLWCCVATVAPADRRAWFDRLAELQRELFPGRFQLQFSVNSTDESERRRLMPTRLESLDWIAARAAAHFRAGDRKLGLNFALAAEVAFEPRVIIERFDPTSFAVKLTPVNPTAAAERNDVRTLLRARPAEVLADKAAELQAAGFEVLFSVGDERENEVGSNCGQAVRRYVSDAAVQSPC